MVKYWSYIYRNNQTGKVVGIDTNDRETAEILLKEFCGTGYTFIMTTDPEDDILEAIAIYPRYSQED